MSTASHDIENIIKEYNKSKELLEKENQGFNLHLIFSHGNADMDNSAINDLNEEDIEFLQNLKTVTQGTVLPAIYTSDLPMDERLNRVEAVRKRKYREEKYPGSNKCPRLR